MISEISEKEKKLFRSLWYYIKEQPKLDIDRPDNITDYLPIMDFGRMYIAGGAARQFYETGSFKTTRDIDIFFSDNSYFLKLANWLDRNPNAENIPQPQKYDSMGGPLPPSIYSTIYYNYLGYMLNLVNMNPYQNAVGTLSEFDLTVAQFATDGHNFYYTNEAIRDAEAKTLNWANFDKMVLRHSWQHTEKRLNKYMSYGFEPTDEMVMDIVTNGEYSFMPRRELLLKLKEKVEEPI